jgi:molybdate transport system ATP-binding protein
LRAIAGLVRPDAGRIVWQLATPPAFGNDPPAKTGNVAFTVFDSSVNKWFPAYRRGIALAPQAASLFPHKDVRENVAYCIRQMDERSRNKIDATLALFRIAHLADKRPAELSGGEEQRVNLARAAAAADRDSVLLMDEPFAGLDTILRTDLMLDLQTWAATRNLCVLSVTHDVAEAFQLGAEVIKIADGKVVEQGPVKVVLAEERKRLLAQLGG